MRERHRCFLHSSWCAAAAFAAFAAAAPALAAAPDAAASEPAAVLGTHVFETRGRIVDVDAANHRVTLSGERGTRLTFDVDPAVADVSKLAPGDQVDVVYRHALLLRVDRSGSGIRSRVETTSTEPAMGGVTSTTHRVEVTATIREIGRARRELTLRGPTGTVVLDVPPTVSIESLRVGQKVRASYVTQSAVKVTRDGQPVH